MRRGIFLAGIIVIVLGVIFAGLSFPLSQQSNTIPDPSTFSALTIAPGVIGSATAKVSWSGAGQNFSFIVAQCTDSSCNGAGATLAAGSGSSGEVSFSVSGGQKYIFIPQNNHIAVPVTIAITGLTYFLLVGIIAALIGAVVAGFGYVLRAKPRRARVAAPAPKSILPPLAREEEDGGVYVAPTSQKPATSFAESSGPVFFQPTAPEELYGANDPVPTEAPAPGERPWTKCASCGTMNEPWLHNCRWCKRALTSTGG